MRAACLSAIGFVATHAVFLAQSPADRNWADRSANVTSLAVMIDAGEDESCLGAGFIVGIEPPKIYIATAEHVVQEVEELGPVTNLGVRIRFARPFDCEAPFERRAKARVMRKDAAFDLAALEIQDAELAKVAATRVNMKLAGDSEHLVPGDPIYAVGCGNGLDWDMPAALTKILPRKPNETRFPITYTKDYVREGFSGGPLIHMLHTTGTIVGMNVQVGEDVGRAAGLRQVLERVRSWGVPVGLTAPSTNGDCTYAVSSTDVALTGERREMEVIVKTGAACPWGIQSQTDARLVEREGYWFEASGPDGKGEGRREYVGPGRVLLSAGPAAPCNGKPEHAVARVAGQMIQVQYDGRCTSPAPPGRVARNPEFIRTTPAAKPAPFSRPPAALASVNTNPGAANAVREALGMLSVDRGMSRVAWGCSLYGCRFYEGGIAGFCDPAVTRVELGESAERFTFELDRADCGRSSNERVLCADAPHLPFSVAPGKTIYARMHFGDVRRM